MPRTDTPPALPAAVVVPSYARYTLHHCPPVAYDDRGRRLPGFRACVAWFESQQEARRHLNQMQARHRGEWCVVRGPTFSPDRVVYQTW
jgi:hypothetical protein